jgi:acetate kinase
VSPDLTALEDRIEALEVAVAALEGCSCEEIDLTEVKESISALETDLDAYKAKTDAAIKDVLAKLELCRDLAPLHTGAHLQGIAGCLDVMPNTPQVLVFDTAFHQTMSKEAYMYAIPYEMYEKYSVRRYGAHGTSHRYVSGEMIKLMGGEANGKKIVTCHIGNGSSISGVKDGKCYDTSMGFTPLDGIMMGTRCGAIDPAIVPFIMEKKNMTPKEVESYMNKQCGLLGISGVSSDSRDVEAAMKAGNERAALTYDMLCYQIKKFIGAYAAAMGGLDGIVFTAGIGEHYPFIRAKALEGLEFLGVKLDAERNEFGHSGTPVKISADDSRVTVYMIPTNEELVIAADTEAIVSALNK